MANINQVSFTDPDTVDIERIRRNQMLAMQLQNQSQQSLPGGQMAGGYYVPTSPLSHLANALKGVNARNMMENSDKELKALGEARAGERSSTLASALKAMQGTPGSTESPMDEQANDGMGARLPINAPAMPADPQRGMNILAGSKDPMLQNMGLQQIMEQIKRQQAEPTKVDLGDRIGLMKDGKIVGEIPKNATPDTTVKERGLDRRFEGVSGNTRATVDAANARHITPSGSAILGERGAMARHASPSGSAILGAETTRFTHGTPSANALLGVNPAVQGPLAEAKAAGSERGQAVAQAQLQLPQVISKAEQTIQNIDAMIGDLGKDPRDVRIGEKRRKPHPGFENYVGTTWKPGARFVEGSDASDFEKRLNQTIGGAFLQAFESLKGGGAITEIEGRKATDAITRMHKSQSEAEFVTAAREFQNVVRTGVENARKKAGGMQGVPAGGVLQFDANGNPIP